MTNLIKGYRTHTFFSDKPRETLYAVYDDGRIYRTNPLSLTSTFNQINRPWFRVDQLPEDAEFIGNYDAPVASAKQGSN